MNINNDLNFIGSFAGSLRDRQTGLDQDPSGADSVPLSQSLTLLVALTLMEESLYQVFRLPLVKGSFSLITEMIVRSTMIVITMSGS